MIAIRIILCVLIADFVCGSKEPCASDGAAVDTTVAATLPPTPNLRAFSPTHGSAYANKPTLKLSSIFPLSTGLPNLPTIVSHTPSVIPSLLPPVAVTSVIPSLLPPVAVTSVIPSLLPPVAVTSVVPSLLPPAAVTSVVPSLLPPVAVTSVVPSLLPPVAVTSVVPSLLPPVAVTSPSPSLLPPLLPVAVSTVKLIGYIPGWLTPPPASELAAAGYTHAVVAFGVFSTSSPGTIVNAFSTVSAAYVSQLHAVGIRVLLSLGGASTSVPETSVDFGAVLRLASSSSAFQSTFVDSVLSFVSTYGFDGIDIDIEHGLTPSGTFTSPTGDILVLSNILNQLHSQSPSLLISLAPQSANIAATTGFNDPFGNYASLIMQTASALSWVGVQLYNTGCCLGLNQVCYATDPDTNPDFSVAMAADLLEDWPSVNALGQQTGFQAYVSPLTPDQVVLGYPCVDSAGVSDGSPATPTSTIKRAIQCLRSGLSGFTSCNTYTAPSLYANIGGVFDWQVYNDQSNGYQFAKDMAPCLFLNLCLPL